MRGIEHLTPPPPPLVTPLHSSIRRAIISVYTCVYLWKCAQIAAIDIVGKPHARCAELTMGLTAVICGNPLSHNNKNVSIDQRSTGFLGGASGGGRWRATVSVLVVVRRPRGAGELPRPQRAWPFSHRLSRNLGQFCSQGSRAFRNSTHSFGYVCCTRTVL